MDRQIARERDGGMEARGGVRRRGSGGVRLALLAAGATLLAGACDPCSGVSVCGDAMQLSYQGEVTDRRTWGPVPGAEVTFVRTGGGAVASDSFTVVADAQGMFEFRTATSGREEVAVELRVRPPSPYRPFVVAGLQLRPTRKGDVLYLGRLFADRRR